MSNMQKLSFYQTLICIAFFFLSTNTYSQDKIIQQGDTWQYYDNGSLNDFWAKQTIDSKNWKEGITPFGYKDKKVITEIGFGGNKENKHITKYFKKTFILQNPLDYIAYEIKVQRDDGVVVYLNGKEIYRNNMGNGAITSQTAAQYTVQGAAESVYLSKVIDSKEFMTGSNTFSVSIHQSGVTSPDCFFNLELFGHNNARVLSAIINDKSSENTKLEGKIKNLASDFELKNKAVQISFLEASNDNLKFLLFLISFLLIMSIILAYNMILKYRKNEELSTSKQFELNELVFNKDREMMTISTQLLHNKQYFKEIKSELNHIKVENPNALKGIIKQLDFVIENESEWEQLNRHFNAVYSGFYDKLIELHPTLTEIELRHCMFIKLHMQTKEIARILHVDPRSVQASRYRVKKKMNLDEETDLRNYIIHIFEPRK